jgi:membrane protein implicated in regulation of membrane protease activity
LVSTSDIGDILRVGVREMKDFDWAFWFGLAVVFGIVEVTSLDLVFAMLAVGALAGAVTGAFTDNVVIEAVVAMAVAVGMLFVVRPVALSHLRTPLAIRTGVAALIGERGVALERVDGQNGRIKLKGEVWSARTYDPSHVIEAGTHIEVVQIDGATAVVYEAEI